MNPRRLALATLVAFVVTMGLFMLMQTLIAMADPALGKDDGHKVIEFVRLKRSSETQTKKRVLPQKVKPKPKPNQPDLDMDSSLDGLGGPSVDIGKPTLDGALDLRGGLSLGAAPSDRELVPIVRVRPLYPPRAAQRKIEGWVLLEFTVTASGTVREPKVIDAKPKGVFDRAAKRAIRKWKYKAKVVDGKPVEQPGIRTKLNFNLEGT
ncbi:MAG: energy transducer TonB [Myxococcota bacterium]|nr:energy transducer TonB [Myxococcota bacterium]